MSDKYQNKYRSESARAQWWDYGNNGAYFITGCTHRREHNFGKIENEKMYLSSMGKIAEQYFLKMPKYFPYIFLDEFVVMPDHFHAIVIIDKTNSTDTVGTVETRLITSNDTDGTDGMDGTDDTGGIVGARLIASLQTPPEPPEPPEPPNPPDHPKSQLKQTGGITGNKNPMLNENLSRVFRWYKGRVTFECRKIYKKFAWQSRFHDHIIRNEEEYYRIKNYIRNNPKNWKK